MLRVMAFVSIGNFHIPFPVKVYSATEAPYDGAMLIIELNLIRTV